MIFRVAEEFNTAAFIYFNGQVSEVTGFVPDQWSWANERSPNGEAATLSVASSGTYTISLWMREDGLRVDRLLLTTDTNYIPTDFGPTETSRQPGVVTTTLTVDRVIDYDYDNLYRLTEASYSTGEIYEYAYDPVGNRLQQIIDGDTTDYLYDAANRLEFLNGQPVYTFDANGNLLNSDTMTNTWDAANRLTHSTNSTNATNSLTPIYNGVNDRIGQVTDGITTTFALDVQGLPEVIYTSDGEAYLHLPGVIVTEKAGEVRYLLSDGLGSVRQVVDENAAVVAYQEFDPYGSPVQGGDERYGYTGEWWEDDVQLLHLRARWYLPSDGVFLSKDAWAGNNLKPQTLNGYSYVEGNPTLLVDPSGYCGNLQDLTPCPYGSENVLYCKLPELGSDPNEEPICYCKGPNPCTEKGERARRIWGGIPVGFPPTPVTLIPAEVILFGDQRPPRLRQTTEMKLKVWGYGLGSVGMDIVEASSAAGFNIVNPYLAAYTSDIFAATDILLATSASYNSGETYWSGKPHPCLPPMTVVGQDVVVSIEEFGGGIALKYIPGVPPIVGNTVDFVTSSASAYYDYRRLPTPFFADPIPTYFAVGIVWEPYPHPALLIYDVNP